MVFLTPCIREGTNSLNERLQICENTLNWKDALKYRLYVKNNIGMNIKILLKIYHNQCKLNIFSYTM